MLRQEAKNNKIQGNVTKNDTKYTIDTSDTKQESKELRGDKRKEAIDIYTTT